MCFKFENELPVGFIFQIKQLQMIFLFCSAAVIDLFLCFLFLRAMPLSRGFEDNTYWHMVRDGLIQFVWYLTGPLITTVWELIGVARPSEENRRQTDAGTHTPPALFVLLSRERHCLFIHQTCQITQSKSLFSFHQELQLPVFDADAGNM